MADVIVVGAGPAGLAAGRALRARGLEPRIFERGDRPGFSWSRLYDSLTLHTGKHLSALPGLRFDRRVPLFPSRLDFLGYLERYADRFRLELETGVSVLRANPAGNGNGWKLETTAGELETKALVFATGIIANPYIPALPGSEDFRGRIMHSIDYRNPAPFLGRRVLVVGVGNSGGEIGSELARAGVDVTVAVRSGANVVPLTLFGLPIQYLAHVVRRLPRSAQEVVVAAVRRITELRRGPPALPRPGYGPLDAIPLIGFHLVDEIKAGRVRVAPGITHLTPSGAAFTDGSHGDFDAIILATGFRPAIDALKNLVRVDARGFALRSDRITSADQPRLFFVGHNYDSSGGLLNIARDSELAAEAVAASLSV